MNRKRCVVISTGFYEWEKGPTKSSRKTPFLIRLGTPEGPRDFLLMAGLYDIWKPPGGGEPLYSYTICTTAANEQFEWLHHRLPCILETEKDVADWLDVGGLPGDIAADRVLRTTNESLVWMQMSSDLMRPVGPLSSKYVKPDIKSFFKKKVEQKPEGKQKLQETKVAHSPNAQQPDIIEIDTDSKAEDQVCSAVEKPSFSKSIAEQNVEQKSETRQKVEQTNVVDLESVQQPDIIEINSKTEDQVHTVVEKPSFSKSIAERTLANSKNKSLSTLQSPIRKSNNNFRANRNTPKKSPKRNKDSKQKSITSFFRKSN